MEMKGKKHTYKYRGGIVLNETFKNNNAKVKWK